MAKWSIFCPWLRTLFPQQHQEEEQLWSLVGLRWCRQTSSWVNGVVMVGDELPPNKPEDGWNIFAAWPRFMATFRSEFRSLSFSNIAVGGCKKNSPSFFRSKICTLPFFPQGCRTGNTVRRIFAFLFSNIIHCGALERILGERRIL